MRAKQFQRKKNREAGPQLLYVRLHLHPSRSALPPFAQGAQPSCSQSRRSEAGLPEFEKLPAGTGRRGHTHRIPGLWIRGAGR